MGALSTSYSVYPTFVLIYRPKESHLDFCQNNQERRFLTVILSIAEKVILTLWIRN